VKGDPEVLHVGSRNMGAGDIHLSNHCIDRK
jgi:hypothetical protein